MNKLGVMSKSQLTKYILIHIVSIIVAFLIGFFVTNQVNRLNTKYQTEFTYNGTTQININDVLDKEYLNTVIKNHPGLDIDDVDVTSLLNNKDFYFIKLEDNKYQAITKTRYYNDSFISSSQKVINRAQTFIKYSLIDKYGKDNITFLDNGKTINSFSTWIGGTIAGASGLILTSLILAFIPSNKLEEEKIEDNENLFHTPFHKKYWKLSLTTLKDTRSIVTLGMLFGLLLLSKLIHIPSGFLNMGIGLGYLFLAVIGMIYGPLVSIVIGLFSDVIGYFIGQNAYGFNPLYTIQAILASLTYALCFYRTKVTFTKVLLSRLIVNLILNVAYGSLLMIIMYYSTGKIDSQTFMNAYKVYALYYSLPKNLVYLIPQTLILFLLLKGIAPILSRMHYIDEEVGKHIDFI